MAQEEPVGSDAILIQLAIVARAMCGADLNDLLVLSNSQKQSAEQMVNIMKNFANVATEKEGEI